MKSEKWPSVIINAEKYKTTDTKVLAALCDCDPRTVLSALERKEAAHLIKTPGELLKELQCTDPSEVDPLDLLFRNIIKLNTIDNPSIQAVNCLITFLDKTGQLVPKGMDEEVIKRINKLSIDALVEVSTGQAPDEPDIYQ